MDIDGDENETQQALKVTDYGVKVDFENLREEEGEVSWLRTPVPLSSDVLTCSWLSLT
jgi:hypothetical protein